MKYNIRNITDNDYELIASWWKEAKEPIPSKGLMPSKTHFILENDNTPIMSIGLFLTNSELAYVENFICNPLIENTKEASNLLTVFIIEYAKKLGFKRIGCFTKHDSLVKRYTELGMTTIVPNVTVMAKEL